MSPSLSPKERKIIHAQAGVLGLSHESVGKKAKRHIVVGKPEGFGMQSGDASVIEVLSLSHFGRYIGLTGPAVDRVGAKATALGISAGLFSSSAANARLKRDGANYHITLLSKPEAAGAASAVAAAQGGGNPMGSVLSTLSGRREPTDLNGDYADPILEEHEEMMADPDTAFVDNWVALGIGSVSDGPNTTWYAVLEWESGNAALARLGLPPKDFHITLAFEKKDVHGVGKGVDTMVMEVDREDLML